MSAKKNDAGTWDFQCERQGQCGDLGEGVPFRSTGWPTKAAAVARGEEHEAEHDKGKPMSSLHEFRAKHNVEV